MEDQDFIDFMMANGYDLFNIQDYEKKAVEIARKVWYHQRKQINLLETKLSGIAAFSDFANDTTVMDPSYGGGGINKMVLIDPLKEKDNVG